MEDTFGAPFHIIYTVIESILLQSSQMGVSIDTYTLFDVIAWFIEDRLLDWWVCAYVWRRRCGCVCGRRGANAVLHAFDKEWGMLKPIFSRISDDRATCLSGKAFNVFVVFTGVR